MSRTYTRPRRTYIQELKRALRDWSFRTSVGILLFPRDIDLDDGPGRFVLELFGFHIPLTFLDRLAWNPRNVDDGSLNMESWSLGLMDNSEIIVGTGRKHKFFSLPWSWDHCRHEIMLKSHVFRLVNRQELNPEDDTEVWRETHPYHYTLRSGEIQVRTATITVHRRTWTWHWPKFLGWPRKVKTVIDVRFSDEVGERTGSWKGGCIGCGYTLQRNETPLQCLRRMESERKF